MVWKKHSFAPLHYDNTHLTVLDYSGSDIHGLVTLFCGASIDFEYFLILKFKQDLTRLNKNSH